MDTDEEKDYFTKAVINDTTNDWVECYTKPENRTGFTWRMSKLGFIPVGVNINDPRVVALLKL